MHGITKKIRLIGSVAAVLLLLYASFGLGAAPQVASAAGTIYYISPIGNDSASGSSAAPWRTIEKAARTIQPGDTVMFFGGVYRVNSILFAPAGVAFDKMVTYKAVPGTRPIFTTSSDMPPAVSVRSFVRLEGLWFGGRWKSNTVAFSTGGSPISRGVQLVGNTLFGYTELSQGSAEYTLYQNNRFVLMGKGTFQHGIYVSGGYTAGSLAQHTIIDNNLFIGGEGYGIHNWHNTRSNIITRNFVTGHYWGMIQEGEDHLVANNFFWKMDGQPGGQGPWGAWLKGSNIQFINNILGPNGYAWGATTNNTIRKNAFLSTSKFGNDTVTLTAGREQTEIGRSAQQIDSAIAALEQAFSQPVTSIYDDGSIESYFATLKFSVPSGSPLRGTGQSWVPGVSSINIGPDAPAPSSFDKFWGAFCALGLRNWDNNGSIIQ